MYQLGVSNGWIKSVFPGKQEQWQEELLKKSDWLEKNKKFGLQVGMVLKKEFNGEVHEVAVGDKAYHYRGKSYTSLAYVARDICGSIKSRRFFGL